MASSDTRTDPEATLPPARALSGAICPVCFRKGQADDAAKSARASLAAIGRLPRCPDHDVALVDAHDVVAAGGDALLGTTIAERFTVLARLGSGSMGSVYRARQEAVGRDVALKIVRRDRAYDPETKARFEREARATSALVSPHTVTVFDFGEADDGSWFLAMELLDGETLGQRLKRVQRLPPAEAVLIAKGALKSLAEAHALGIIHRDLKPDNLFLVRVPDEAGDRRAETCKVLDFGIAKLLRDEGRVDQLETQAGTVFGTPRFMSPEQAQGNPLDPRSDLYSLGVILYMMLAGRAPFVDDDAVVVMARHIKDPPPRFADVAPELAVPPALERVVRRALAKNPGDRPASAEQLVAELDAALGPAPAATSSGLHNAASWAGPDTGAFAPTPGRRQRLFVVGALAVAAIGVVSVVVARGFRVGPASPPAASAVAAVAPPASGPVAPLPPAPLASGAPPIASAADDAGTAAKSPDRALVAPARAPRRAPGPPYVQRKSGDHYGRFE